MLARVSRVSASVLLSTHSRPTPLNGQVISIHGLAQSKKWGSFGHWRPPLCSERPAFAGEENDLKEVTRAYPIPVPIKDAASFNARAATTNTFRVH